MRTMMMKLRKYRSVFGGLLALVAIGGVVSGIYGWRLYHDVEQRFSGRRWSIPSQIFSDASLLYPGMRINRPLFLRKLHRLGYRSVKHVPRQKGDMRATGTVIELFLHDLHLPDDRREGFAVRMHFDRQTLSRLERIPPGPPLARVTLEPEKLGFFFGPEREKRELIAIDQIPKWLTDAVLVAEDSRFFEHFGLDWRGIGRALLANLRSGGIRQGGSTITQQLAKNFFLTSERTLMRKWKEMVLALVIEGRYDKSTIFEMYLNEIYLGQNGSVSINGIGEASRFYFGKPAGELTIAEAATLAGLIKSPNTYSPYADVARCRQRRDDVLHAMHSQGWITSEEYAIARLAAVQPAGFTAHESAASYFVDYLSHQMADLYASEDLASLGLSIYTTLDTQVQEAAETALANGLERIEAKLPDTAASASTPERLQGAVVVMKPQTGAVLAMVGGRDYRLSQFNRIVQARRQAGSTFKVFTYLAALDTYTPISALANQERTYEVDGKPWQPRNSSVLETPVISLREALARSVNRATVDLAMKVGMETVVRTAQQFEFSTPLERYPSLALGAVDVAPIELARAYCVFPAAGLLPNPIGLLDVYDEHGQPLERRHMRARRIIPPERAFLMTSLLRSAVLQGTARGLADWGIYFPVAGKTGTTNNSRDAWFVGYTPDILILVWVGYDSGASIHASGAGAALPIWAELARAIPHQITGGDFAVPPGVEERIVCSRDGFPDLTAGCGETMAEWFLSENVPEDSALFSHPDSVFQRLMQKFKGAIDAN
jgi:penicillin-binding protein 1B